MDKMSFVSIDFETMTPELSSACAVGLVKVVDNVIVQKFYSLIKPIPDNRTERNTFVHGITDEMVENAPTWAQLYPQIASMFDSGVIACHSASTDVNVLKLINSHYGITLPVQEVKDTFAITGKSLVESCQDAGIDFGNHHDPLCDATAGLMIPETGPPQTYSRNHSPKSCAKSSRSFRLVLPTSACGWHQRFNDWL